MRVDVAGDHFVWIAFDAGVVEQTLGPEVFGAEADDHAMHGGNAARFVVPGEGAVREMNVQAVAQRLRPEHADLFALADRMGGHEPATERCSLSPCERGRVG